MKSIRELYLIGRGPSSSHTMGPAKAAALFRAEQPEADRFCVVLYGSLALTGKGHLTDQALQETLAPVETDIVFETETTDLPHPTTMDLFAYQKGKQTGFLRVLSTGGGAITLVGRPEETRRRSIRSTPMRRLRHGAKAIMRACRIMWSIMREPPSGTSCTACGRL